MVIFYRDVIILNVLTRSVPWSNSVTNRSRTSGVRLQCSRLQKKLISN